MSTEAECLLKVGNEQFSGKARLDMDHIDFTGQTKFRFRLAEIRDPSFSSGALRFEFHGNKIALSVGDRTARWYDAVVHPKSPAEKLAARSGMQIRIVNFDDESVIQSLQEKRAQLVTERCDQCDMILLGVERPADLRQVPSLAETLTADGALWIVIHKTARAVTQGNIVAAARAARLHEVRDVSLSDAFAAYKLVAAVSLRRNGTKKTDGAKVVVGKSRN